MSFRLPHVVITNYAVILFIRTAGIFVVSNVSGKFNSYFIQTLDALVALISVTFVSMILERQAFEGLK